MLKKLVGIFVALLLVGFCEVSANDSSSGGGSTTVEITGQVVDTETFRGISSASISLLVRNSRGAYSYLAWTSSDTRGRFAFSQDYDGNSLQAGTYRLEAYAEKYYLGIVEFDAAGGTTTQVVAMQSMAVTLECEAPRLIPSKGGNVSWECWVKNDGSETLMLITTATLSAQSGRGLYFLTEAGVKTSRLKKGEGKKLTFRVKVSPDIPDSSYVCLNVQTSGLSADIDLVGQDPLVTSGACAQKGVKDSGGGGGGKG